MKDDAIVLVEAAEIMESLPPQMQHDDQIMDSVIESLQSGVSKLAARQDALEIAQLKLQETVAHGFKLVNDKFVTIQHEVEKDRIHAEYAKKEAIEAKNFAQRAWEKTQEQAIKIARAEEKAEAAKDLAKQSRIWGFDPLTGMLLSALGIVGSLVLIYFGTQSSQPRPSSKNLDMLTCGVEVICLPNQPRQPMPAKEFGGV